jgi:hypothetical protein
VVDQKYTACYNVVIVINKEHICVDAFGRSMAVHYW